MLRGGKFYLSGRSFGLRVQPVVEGECESESFLKGDRGRTSRRVWMPLVFWADWRIWLVEGARC